MTRTYTDELLLALRLRDVPGPRIAEALAEIDSHVAETGEDPREAFGPPKAYADQLVMALGAGTEPPPVWRGVLSWTAVTYAVGGSVGAWLLIQGVQTLVTDAQSPSGLPGGVSLALGLAVLGALGLGLGRLARDSTAQVLDPRTGADLTPPLPRWVRPLMLTAPLLPIAMAVVLAVLAE